MNLSIKSRMVLLGTALAFIPTVIVGLILSQQALNEGGLSLSKSAESRLTAVTELTAESITSYFDIINRQAITMAEDPSIVEATQLFESAFWTFEEQQKQSAQANKTSLQGYYSQDFDSQYKALNGGESSSPSTLLNQLDSIAVALQAKYISTNSAPLGEKDSLTSTGDGTDYDAVHTKYHPALRKFQQEFGYYDVFIADAKTGHIIYSVYKELDFATSLLNGPYAQTGIADAFRMAKDGRKGETYLTDFAPYGPSYNAQASFISTPIYSGSQRIGVLIFQMPVDRMNEVINHHNNWEKGGLGKTGFSYLVGSDKHLRSNLRPLYENLDGFIADLKSNNAPDDEVSDIQRRGSTIGLLTLNNQAVQAGLSGQSGTVSEQNFLGEPVLSAYRPLSILGLNWVLVTELSVEEALASIENLESLVTRNIILCAVAALLGGALLGYLFAVYMMKPINRVVHLAADLGEGEGDLTRRLPVTGNDELTELSRGVNAFIQNIDHTLSTVLKSVVRLVPISKDMAEVVKNLNTANAKQQYEVQTVNDGLRKTNEASEAVVSELTEIDSSTQEGLTTVTESGRKVKEVAQTMEVMSSDIQGAIQALDTLKSDTDKITSVIDVINGIAEQTNLLALNAAIEAARAGEAGRGFAVVADEVRTLASKTRESTNEVAAMVGAIQTSTSDVSQLMESCESSASTSVAQVGESTDALEHITHAMNSIAEKVQRINDSITLQQTTFRELESSFTEMNDTFENVNGYSEDSSRVADDVMKLGNTITGHIEHFKVSDENLAMDRRSKTRTNDDA